MRATIVLLPGDGIGPEVVDAAARVLRKIELRFGHSFTLKSWPIGAAALRGGDPPLPSSTLEACLNSDAVLLGAVGDPEYNDVSRDQRPEMALLELRRALGTFANLRPARVWPGLESGSVIREEVVRGLDLLIVRELTGGIYFGEPRGRTDDEREAFDTMRYSATEIERIAVVAFESARRRRKLVTSVDKANVLESSRLWREVVTKVASRFSDVRLQHQLVDSCAMLLVSNPGQFDVLLAGNLFGDILSDEAGAVVGSLGLLPSASIGGNAGIFEPVHGSAPDIAGSDRANPVATIASAALLLRYAFGAEMEAATIEAAIGEALNDGFRTADLALGGMAVTSCSQMTQAIIDRMERNVGVR
jgi:3-isopropylmalate dehydrogenase